MLRLHDLGGGMLFNTVPIETLDQHGTVTGSGTSFAIAHRLPNGFEELFLVTNKHVVDDAWAGTCFFSTLGEDGPIVGKPFFLKLDEFFSGQWHPHPNPAIDICILPLTWPLLLIGQSGIRPYYTRITTDLIIPPEAALDVDILQPIAFVGYPNGLYDEQHFTPIVRSGVIATPLQLDWNGSQAFLIDASVFPGSSGSPVFMVQSSGGDRPRQGPMYLIGVLAAVMIQLDTGELQPTPAPTSLAQFVSLRQVIDLGIVIKGSAITETIADFWKEKGSKNLDFYERIRAKLS